MLTSREAADLDAYLASGPPDWDEGLVECGDCDGTGWVPCPVCGGQGSALDAEESCAGCEDLHSYRVKCWTCNGDGMVDPEAVE